MAALPVRLGSRRSQVLAACIASLSPIACTVVLIPLLGIPFALLPLAATPLAIVSAVALREEEA